MKLCGLVHSILVMTPVTVTGLLASYSAPKEWCNPATANAKSKILILDLHFYVDCNWRRQTSSIVLSESVCLCLCVSALHVGRTGIVVDFYPLLRGGDDAPFKKNGTLP